MSTPPPLEETQPAPALRARLRTLSGTQRELIILAVALLCGAVLMPLLIWLVGNRVLGPYPHGQNLHAGPAALLGDFFVGLVHGSAVFWVVALGPAAVLVLVRVFVRLLRLGAGRRTD